MDKEISGLAYDSREVKKGYLFFALPGTKTDGRNYIPQAIKNGALAVVTTGGMGNPPVVTAIVTPQPQILLGILSARFYNYPSEKLLVLGVTGTNGKTTVTYFLDSIFSQAGQKTAIIGTIANRLGEEILPAQRTTPQSLDLQVLLARAVNKGVKVVALEVSSHALAQGRVEGCEFDVGIFTNLTRDHLDYHQTMENYLAAKSQLFQRLNSGKKNSKFAIINLDDPAGGYLEKISSVSVSTYSWKNKAAHFFARDISLGKKNTEFNLIINVPGTNLMLEPVKLNLVGSYNISNALAAAAAAFSRGIKLNSIVRGLEKLANVPGRFERIYLGQPFSCIVDYAHTDDALEKILLACRELTPRRIITVFGCGGDRDRSKRPLMGEVASRLSDFVFVTSDNPRSENPEAIAGEIAAGIIEKNRRNYTIVVDRRQAIEAALNFAEAEDLVLIAGKGHEQEQIFADHSEHFDDREVVREILTKAGKGRGKGLQK